MTQGVKSRLSASAERDGAGNSAAQPEGGAFR